MTVAAWLRHPLDAPLIDSGTACSMMPLCRPANRPAARQVLLEARLSTRRRRGAGCCGRRRRRRSGSTCATPSCPAACSVFLIAYAGAALASAGSWWLIGGAALEGRFDPGTLLAWSFLLLSVVPLGLFAMWSQGVFMVGVSGILKLRLLAGALKLDPDETRHEGIGQHLARVIESESLEGLVLTGGFYALTGDFRSRCWRRRCSIGTGTRAAAVAAARGRRLPVRRRPRVFP